MLAVGLRLRGGPSCLPPTTYLGGKRTYAGPLLAGLGLRSGSGCRDLWLADAGPAGDFWRALASEPESILEPLAALIAEREPQTPDEARALYAELRELDAPWAWLVCAAWSYRAGVVESGFAAEPRFNPPAHTRTRLDSLRDRTAAAARVVGGARVWSDARDIPVSVAGRTVVFLDPDYVGTTGYGSSLPRAEVVALARAWFEAGAEVVVTERESVVPGWRAVRVQPEGEHAAPGAWEFATLSPNVEWRIGEPLSLFGSDDLAPAGSAMTGYRARGAR